MQWLRHDRDCIHDNEGFLLGGERCYSQFEVAMKTPRIVSNPKIMLGKPVIEGTRITVEYILEELGHGQTFEGLLRSHPTMTQGGIHAALDYASKVLKSEVVHPIETG